MYIIFTIMIFITTAIIILVFKISAALTNQKALTKQSLVLTSVCEEWCVKEIKKTSYFNFHAVVVLVDPHPRKQCFYFLANISLLEVHHLLL